ncbi:Multidrug resistance-associated protein 1 [Armadillidium nasatum]|uniref:Multidrug resistance-associated protein 1 n=1 Tax=Armadillidium nasatum TaxID=96803 RepID=A0A5N5TCG5_9CRUS|nr:Multidrug resistance-associated protein 1 [Armadillidium nasatum]
MNITGLKIRSMVISAVYQKALKISSSSKKESTVGEIVNLMAVDVQRFLDLIGYINTLWTAPIQIILCMYFLWVQLGPSAMVGLVILFILIPINGVIARFQKIYQIAQMKKKDKRIKLINEILNGIKVLKLYAWEMSFNHYITDIRKDEVKVLKRNAMLGAITSFILSCTPFMISYISCYMTYVLLSNQLTPGTVFVSISLLNILRMPMVMIPFLIISMVQANVSLKRMNKFLRSEELDPDLVERDEKEEDPLVIKDGSFMWGGEESETPTLRNINLRVKEGSLVGIVGTVGCGKSSLCLSMLGEMDKISGKVIVNKSLAYVPQQAWIQNETIKENILFGKEFQSSLYNKVVSACALEPDFKMLANGDQTEIGEKGINLSGGQKQRVNLARAVYSDSEIYLLDDPLSAVDSHVGKHIFEHVIGPKGILKDKTRILVTHGLGYLKNMDEIIVLKDGEIVERGTLTFLINQKGDFQDFLMQYLNQNEFDDEELRSRSCISLVLEEIRKTIGDNPLQRQKISSITNYSGFHQSYGLRDRRGTATSSIKSFEKKKEVDEDIDKGKIIKEEDTGGGRMSWGVYVYYARSIGSIAFTLTVFYYAASQAFSVLGNVLLSQWSEDPDSTEISKRNKYLGAYAGFGAGQSIFSFLGYYVMTWYAINASKGLHNRMLDNVLRCPMTFFDQTPIGRIVNRFSKGH